MRRLSIDIETYSSIDLTKSGGYSYANSPDFEILLFAYAFDNGPVCIIDLAQGEVIPPEIMEALTDENTIKSAFNANFERTCLSAALCIPMPPEQWQCTMVHGLMLGLPGSLAQIADTLNLEQQKMSEGKALIKYFSVPCKPTKINGGRCRNLPEHDIEKWELFKEYCKQDVETERAVKNKVMFYKIPDFEKKLWNLDQKINDTGVLIDTQMVVNAIKCDDLYTNRLSVEMNELTGLDNPNSAAQLKTWIKVRTGSKVDSLDKEHVEDMLKTTADAGVCRVLELRQGMAKTSTSKYKAMLESQCNDNRIRGMLQHYGANRSGRWAGRLVQFHNLPQNKLQGDDLELARTLVKNNNLDDLEMMYGDVSSTLSQLIRTAFIPEPGKRFIVADFSSIEARVTAWLAGEKWRMDVFNSHGKIYEASAAQMFHVPVESITKGNPLRQKGKISELALGYGGSVGALISMGAIKMGLAEEELQDLVDAWRAANTKITRLWKVVEQAAIKAIEEKYPEKIQYDITFFNTRGSLFIILPSGRRLSYIDAKVERNGRGLKQITYKGVNQTSRKWETTDTWGGKLVENIVQAIARDCLAVAMVRLDEAGYPIVMHVHDEIIAEVPEYTGSVDEACEIMGQPIGWAPGLPLNAEGFSCSYYKKD